MTDSISLVDWLSKIGVTRELNNSDILGGITVNATLTKVIQNYNVRLSATNTAANRVNNWNTLIAQLEKLGINVTQQDKGKIIGGDDKCVYSILHNLKDYADRNREEVEVNLSKIDTRGDPRNSRSLLELFILVIVKYFGFSVKEAVALLSNDSKYLAHILAKGFKDDYRPVVGMLGEFMHLLPQINTFCKNKENEIFFLKSIKPGLISKYLVVSEVSLELLTEFTKNNEGKYEIVKNQLMATLILCLRRHGVQLPLVIKSLTQILGYNKNMLILFMSNGNFSETILLMMEILRLAEEEGQVHEIYQLFKLQEFIQTCIDNIRSSELFINAGSFLLKVAESNYPYLSNNDNIIKIVDSFSSLSLSRKGDIIIHCNLLFAYLQLLAKKKNVIAPQFLRVAVQRYRNSLNEDESHNYLLNFIETVDIFPSIPCSSMVEAILGRYQTATTLIGQLELSIMEISVGSIEEKLALRVYNLITKIFLEQLGYSLLISNVIEAIVTKFESGKVIFDLTVKFVKVSLAVYYANLRKLNYMKSLIDGTVKLDISNAFYKIKNHQIQNMLANIISIRNQMLNKALEPLICYSFIQSEVKNKDQAKGIKKVMLLLGDEVQLRKLYENDAKMLAEEVKNQSKIKTDPRDRRMDLKQKIQKNDVFRYKEAEAKNRVSSDVSLLGKKRDLVLNLSNPTKISSDVQKGLQKYTKAYLERMAKLSLEEDKKLADQQRKQELRRKFTLKILQKGIKINKQTSVNCIYDFNSKEKQQQQDTATDFSYLPFYNPDHEQERDVKALDYLIKKYTKVLKVYYHNYGGRLRPNTIKLFDDISERANLMQTANITKLLRDNQLDHYITGKQVQHIIQKINSHLKKQFRDSSVLDYEVFQLFIVQASLIMFSRPPKDMRSHPISDMFQQVIDKFKEHAPQHKIDEKIFDSESIQTAKPQQLKEMNQKLVDNPDYILPQGYKKLTVKTVIFDHQLHLEALDSHYKDVYEALDQILFDHLGFHIIEPYSTTTVQVTARPLLYQTQISSDQSMKERSLSSVFPKGKETQREGQESQQLSQQQANRERLQNQFLRQKKLKQLERQKRQEEEQKRREQRNKELKSLLQIHRTKQQQMEQKRQEERKMETARQEDEKRKKERYQENLKKKVEEFLEKKKEDKMKEDEAQKRKKEEQIRDFERLKQDIERKKKMVDDSKIKKKQQEDQKKQRENEQKKKLEEDRKNKLIEKKEKNKKLLEEYKDKKNKDKSGKTQQRISLESQSLKEPLAESTKRQKSHKSVSKSNSKQMGQRQNNN